MVIRITLQVENIPMEHIERLLETEEEIVIDYANTEYSRGEIHMRIMDSLCMESVGLYISADDDNIVLEEYQKLWSWGNIGGVVMDILYNMNVYHSRRPYEDDNETE